MNVNFPILGSDSHTGEPPVVQTQSVTGPELTSHVLRPSQSQANSTSTDVSILMSKVPNSYSEYNQCQQSNMIIEGMCKMLVIHVRVCLFLDFLNKHEPQVLLCIE